MPSPRSASDGRRSGQDGRYRQVLIFLPESEEVLRMRRSGEIHHVDAIGMGNDRRTYDDTQCRKMCLCRKHHTTWHQMGDERFQRMYKVYGILMPEEKSSLAEQ